MSILMSLIVGLRKNIIKPVNKWNAKKNTSNPLNLIYVNFITKFFTYSTVRIFLFVLNEK